MKAPELREMDDEQLELTRQDIVKNLFHLRFQSATERLETPSEIVKARKDLARIFTVQRERVSGIRGAKPVTGRAATAGQGAETSAAEEQGE